MNPEYTLNEQQNPEYTLNKQQNPEYTLNKQVSILDFMQVLNGIQSALELPDAPDGMVCASQYVFKQLKNYKNNSLLKHDEHFTVDDLYILYNEMIVERQKYIIKFKTHDTVTANKNKFKINDIELLNYLTQNKNLCKDYYDVKLLALVNELEYWFIIQTPDPITSIYCILFDIVENNAKYDFYSYLSWSLAHDFVLEPNKIINFSTMTTLYADSFVIKNILNHHGDCIILNHNLLCHFL